MKKTNIVLLGMRGSGKSSVGKLLAKTLEKDFFDTDSEVEKRAKTSITELVEEKGWAFFRALEKEVCRDFSQKEKCVLATGGGVVLDEENTDAFKKNGILIFLDVPVEILAQRIEEHSANHRPKFGEKSLQEELKDVWEERKERYLSAVDRVINGTGTHKEVVSRILKSFPKHT